MNRDTRSEGTVIFDAKGLMLHALYGAVDPDAFLIENQLKDGTTSVSKENTAEFGLRAIIERYILPITKDIAPRRIIAVWDGGNEYRKGLHAGYKANRHATSAAKPADVALRDSKLKEAFQRLMATIGITQCQVDGVEADDVIAMLCQKLPGGKLVLTVDADLLQLTTDDIQVMLKGVVPDGDGYLADKDLKAPIPYHLVSLAKSMLGDSSDEYPGVKGFGPAKFNDLVAAVGYDGLEELEACVKSFNFDPIAEILEAATRSKGGSFVDLGDRALSMLYEARNDWGLMYAVASLHPELCFGVRNGKPVKIQWYKRVPSREKLAQLLMAMDCEMFLSRLECFTPTMTLVTNDNIAEVLAHFKTHLADSPYVGFDYESYDTLENPAFVEANNGRDFVDVLSQSITGASFCYGSNFQHAFYMSLDHAHTSNVDESHLVDAILAAQKKCRLVVQNAGFELALTETNLQMRLDTPIDTMIMASYVDENEELGLKQGSFNYLRYKQTTYKEVLQAAGVTNMQQLTGEQVLAYGCDDSICTLHLFDQFKWILDIEGTWDFVNGNEFDVVHPLYDGFEAGVNVDFDRLSELEKDDAVVIKDGMALIRSRLEEHCSVPNVEAAMALYEDMAIFERAKLADAEKSEGFVESKLMKLKEGLINGSVYAPYEVANKAVEFIPTVTKLNEVAEKLHFQRELTSVAASKVSGWLADVDDDLKEDSIGAPEDKITEMVTFMALLTDAVPQLKKREGDAYTALAAFCSEVLSRDAGTVATGTELNFDSPIQMQMMLYCMLGLPVRLRSKVQPGSARQKLNFDGGPATDSKAVEMAIAEDAPVGSWKREFLETYVKVKAALTRGKMYYTAYPLWRHPSDGMVHGAIKNCGTVTRRPSGSSPNLLQISKKDGSEGIRSAIKPRYDDHVIISPDFSGQELRIMTSESLDAVLLEAYLGEVKKDIHSVTASGISPIILERLYADVFKQFAFGDRGMDYDDFVAGRKCDDKAIVKALEYVRKVAKAVNFLIIYGGGPSTLARNLGIPVEMAKSIMEYVFRCYPGIQPWQQRVIGFAKANGYVQDAYGNRRHAPMDLFSNDGNKRSRVERQLANATIQGCAASILKVVLRKAHEAHLFKETGAILIAPVYDELTASVPAASAVEYTRRLVSIMNLTPPGHRVPMIAEVSIGHSSWGDMVELGAVFTDDQIMAACDGEKLKKAA